MVRSILTFRGCILVLSIMIFSCKTESSIPKTDNTVDTNHPSSKMIAGKLNGWFSVSKTKKIQFSQGNLQYQASTNTWKFAENQWDFCGKDNENISPIYDGWIDLFGWGTGDNPTQHSKNDNDYKSFRDWGDNLLTNVSYRWRTLTKDEWVYLFDKRKTNSGIRYAKVTIGDIKGIVLLPDDWDRSNYVFSEFNESDMSYSDDIISQKDWSTMFEDNGAVFLPAAGVRIDTWASVDCTKGNYWSSTPSDRKGHGIFAYNLSFTPDIWLWVDNEIYRHYGKSVRLVCDVE